MCLLLNTNFAPAREFITINSHMPIHTPFTTHQGEPSDSHDLERPTLGHCSHFHNYITQPRIWRNYILGTKIIGGKAKYLNREVERSRLWGPSVFIGKIRKYMKKDSWIILTFSSIIQTCIFQWTIVSGQYFRESKYKITLQN